YFSRGLWLIKVHLDHYKVNENMVMHELKHSSTRMHSGQMAKMSKKIKSLIILIDGEQAITFVENNFSNDVELFDYTWKKICHSRLLPFGLHVRLSN
ncbi:hypothetical protein M8C21_023372, partial [Ambrosia artemisiifolia]